MRSPRQPLRLWWAVPVVVAGTAAVAGVVVIAPTLADRVHVPRDVVITPIAEATSAAPPPVVKPHQTAHPRATASATPPPKPTSPAAVVVQPSRPVVTSPPDDRYGDNTGRRDDQQPGLDR